MKAAFITDDGKSISQHFGRALHYLVLTIEDGKITNREMRDKLGHHSFAGQHGEEGHGHGHDHGHEADAHGKHASMAEVIADCEVVVCGGMGMGAYDSMKRLNIRPVVTDQTEIEVAAQKLIEGKLDDHTELLH